MFKDELLTEDTLSRQAWLVMRRMTETHHAEQTADITQLPLPIQQTITIACVLALMSRSRDS